MRDTGALKCLKVALGHFTCMCFFDKQVVFHGTWRTKKESQKIESFKKRGKRKKRKIEKFNERKKRKKQKYEKMRNFLILCCYIEFNIKYYIGVIVIPQAS